MKFKKIIAGALALTVICGSVIPASSLNVMESCSYNYEENDGRYIYQVCEDHAVLVRPLSDVSGALVIPSYYNGLPVTEIEYDAFENDQDIISVTIPKNIKKMGSGAFGSCINLKDVIFEGDPKDISFGYFAFMKTKWLEDKYDSNGLAIYEGILLDHKDHAEEYVIPDGVVAIGNNAFYNDTDLRKLTIPVGVKRVGESAFFKCSSLTDIDIHSGVKCIEKNAFAECEGLTSLELPDSVTSLGENAFKNCKRVESINIPSYIKGHL